MFPSFILFIILSLKMFIACYNRRKISNLVLKWLQCKYWSTLSYRLLILSCVIITKERLRYYILCLYEFHTLRLLREVLLIIFITNVAEKNHDIKIEQVEDNLYKFRHKGIPLLFFYLKNWDRWKTNVFTIFTQQYLIPWSP